MSGVINRDAWRFFIDHAGYCTPPGRAVCAAELAIAEAWRHWAEGRDALTVEWIDDADADLSWADEATLERIDRGVYFVAGCVVTYKRPVGWSGATTDVGASLWGIVAEHGDSYKRVVEAELCAEVRSQLVP